MLNSRLSAIVCAVIALCSSHFARAQEWADLTMTFLLGGSWDGLSPPMVVDKDTKAIANVVSCLIRGAWMNIPLTVRLWHENSDKSIDEVTLGDKTQFWPKGAVTLTLKEGVNDLGNVIIDRKRFRK